MKNKILILLIFLISIGTIPLGQILWPPAPSHIRPTQIQLIFLIALTFFEALSFGAGLLFVIFGYPHLKKMSVKDKGLIITTYGAISWTLLSWWPHDHLHAHNGDDLTGLIFIEYGFHVTLIIAAIIIGWFFYSTFNELKKINKLK